MDKDVITTCLTKILPSISKESIELYRSLTSLKEFKKGEIIIKKDIISRKSYIIESGFTASFIEKEDGSNFIRNIFKESEPMGSLQSIIFKKKSNAIYKALTNCKVYELNISDFYKIENSEFNTLHTKTIEGVYFSSEERVSELSGLNATKRYIKLRKDIPNIDNILPQYQIANYLNITPIQLSRIRKKIFS